MSTHHSLPPKHNEHNDGIAIDVHNHQDDTQSDLEKVGVLPSLAYQVWDRGVPGTGFWNGTSALKQYFVLPKIASKFYLKHTFFAFPVLGILSLGTPLVWETCVWDRKFDAFYML